MTPDHTTSRYSDLGRVKPELVGLPGKALIQDVTRRRQFIVMQLVGYTPWCSTDACDDVKILTDFLHLGIRINSGLVVEQLLHLESDYGR